jgi:glycosyltransferase involved in cell wall biosynthesis
MRDIPVFAAPNATFSASTMGAAWPGAGSATGFLYVGRLVAEKKPMLLPEASAAALGRLPRDFGLAVVGDGPERARLESLAAAHGLAARVRFTGHVAGVERLRPRYAAAIVPVRLTAPPGTRVSSVGWPARTPPLSRSCRRLHRHGPADVRSRHRGGAAPGTHPGTSKAALRFELAHGTVRTSRLEAFAFGGITPLRLASEAGDPVGRGRLNAPVMDLQMTAGLPAP